MLYSCQRKMYNRCSPDVASNVYDNSPRPQLHPPPPHIVKKMIPNIYIQGYSLKSTKTFKKAGSL